MSITFRQLEVFRAVAQTRSFTRASQKLLVSQSTVSEHIRQLEESLVTKVFDRGRRNISLTASGERLVDYAEKVFALLDEAEVAAKRVEDPFSGKLSIGCASTTLLYHLSAVLQDYAARYPRIELSVVSDRTVEGLLSQLRSGSIEIAVVIFPVSGPEFKKITLLEEPFFWVVPVQHPLSKRKNLDIKDLADESFVLYHQATNTRKVIDRFFRREKVFPRVTMDLNDTEAIKEMVASRLGVTILPASALLVHRRRNELAVFPVKDNQLKRSIGLVYLKTRNISLPAETFCKFLERHFRGHRRQS